jgi:hypothetical protein
MQTKSLRLKDRTGKEWVLRSVEKAPDKILPENFRGTFVVDWVDDAMSAQHPFAALVVPPLAAAAGISHANPIIGVVAEDKNLGEYSETFAGRICLLEEREPAGDSDNTLEMLSDLDKNTLNHVDARNFLKARMLDLMLADWDRHEDQWRWVKEKSEKGKEFTGVPRDRDQVFHLSQGLFPTIAALPWVNPLFDNFDGDIKRVKYSIFKSKFLNPYPTAQLSHTEWMKVAEQFVASQSDSVLEQGLKRLPPEIYAIRHDELFKKLKQRRDNVPEAMSAYYKFVNQTVDLKLSDKSEAVAIDDSGNDGLRVSVTQLVGGSPSIIMDQVYDPQVTQEVRIYAAGGSDSVVVNSRRSSVRLRLIGGPGKKVIKGAETGKKIDVYNRIGESELPEGRRFKLHLSDDSLNTKFFPSNPYNVWMPLASAALNLDDGFLLGLGFKYTQQSGFRKLPYANTQRVMLSHSFATSAFRLKYYGEWIHVAGTTDFTLQAAINAPDNTANFFGTGNGTVLNKVGDYRRYYRTRYNTFFVDPSLRWRFGSGTSLSMGPSLQLYRMDEKDNSGRLIQNSSLIKSYDSTSVGLDRAHVGLRVNYVVDRTNSSILPTSGYLITADLAGYAGVTASARSYLQLRPEFTIYKKLDARGRFVLSDRMGGGISVGHPAFYQSMFLGGQGNLLGYLQNRFAGSHMVYNNFQARVKVANVASYILPGQLGLTGFFDAGRVWSKHEEPSDWHYGTGGGVYFAPAGLTVFQVLAGHSKEGWYPYISLNVRI